MSGSQTLSRVLWFVVPGNCFGQVWTSRKGFIRRKTSNILWQWTMLCDYVLGGMKCGITDRSAGTSDTADGLRVWFTYRGSIGIKKESLDSTGQQARTPPWSAVVIYSGRAGTSPVLQSHTCGSCNCEEASCRGKRALIWISLLTASSSLSHWVKC